LPESADHWSLPEAVPGNVNTPGWEDSAEISPDGKYLIVGTKSPIDYLSCFLAGYDPHSSACNTSLTNITRASWPDFPGKQRILSDTEIDHNCPSFGYVGPNGSPVPFAVPPTASYVFRQQADGSFAFPKIFSFDDDGCLAGFGYSFDSSYKPGAYRQSITYALNDPTNFDMEDTGNDIFKQTLKVKWKNSYGNISLTNGDITVTNQNAKPLLTTTQSTGNPHLGPSALWFDSEGEDSQDIYLNSVNRLKTKYNWSDTKTETILGRLTYTYPRSQANIPETQPHMHDNTLYFTRNSEEIISTAPIGKSFLLWKSEAHWEDEVTELSVGNAPKNPGAIVGIGEPSFATTDLDEELMYFVFIEKTNAGFDANIARVKKK
jgi:hypothetical protein